MSKWYEAGVEAAFKPVAGGYLAKLPGPYLLGSQFYLVDAAQKEQIAAALRAQRKMLLYPLPVLATLGGLVGLYIAVARPTPGATLAALAAVAIVTLVPTFATFAYVRHRLRPLLDTLQPSDQRFSVREQVETMSRRMSMPIILLGLLVGIHMVLGPIVAITNAHRPSGVYLPLQLFVASGGLVMIAYFIWLIVLRRRVNGQAGSTSR